LKSSLAENYQPKSDRFLDEVVSISRECHIMMKKFRGCRIICVGENGQFISIGIINSEYPEYTEGREYGSDMQAMSAKLKEVNAETLKEFEKQSRIHKDIEQCFVKQIE